MIIEDKVFCGAVLNVTNCGGKPSKRVDEATLKECRGTFEVTDSDVPLPTDHPVRCVLLENANSKTDGALVGLVTIASAISAVNFVNSAASKP